MTTSRRGKIARLPKSVRAELNRRLENGEAAKPLVAWLNGLAEVQTLLAAEFGGKPVREQNISEWRKGGYREWLVRQQALEFVRSLEPDDDGMQQALSGPLTDKLAQWLAVRYAAAAHALTATEADPETEWRRLREFCGDIVELRRGDHGAERLRLQREWLALDQANTEQAREKTFWEWTKRPDVREKLFPDGRGGFTQATLEKIERELNLL